MKGYSRRFAIITHPEFSELEDIDMQKAEKYQVHITSSGGNDPAPASEFYKRYHREFGIPPSAYAVTGFDMAMYFGAALWNKDEELSEAIRTQYMSFRNELDFVQNPEIGRGSGRDRVW